MDHRPPVIVPGLVAAPLWAALTVVGLTAAALWGILTVLGAAALETAPTEIRATVSVLAGIGNVMTALAVVAFWPLITWSFWCAGILVTGKCGPDFRDLARGTGMAHLPVLLGMTAVWAIVVAADLSVPLRYATGEEARRCLESLTAVRIARALMTAAYAATVVSFVAVVREVFRSSWAQAAVIVAGPLALYYFMLFAVRGGIR